jgi:hypothetical protein
MINETIFTGDIEAYIKWKFQSLKLNVDVLFKDMVFASSDSVAFLTKIEFYSKIKNFSSMCLK